MLFRAPAPCTARSGGRAVVHAGIQGPTVLPSRRPGLRVNAAFSTPSSDDKRAREEAAPKPEPSQPPEPEPVTIDTEAEPAAEPPSPPPPPPPELAPSWETTPADTKAALLDSLYGTERGLSARSELRAEINELISQLEAVTPTPNPTEALEKLGGTWQLSYTTSPVLLGVLALGRLPLVTVGDVLQRIDATASTVENVVALAGPFSKTSITATASFEARSPKRLQLKLLSGQVATPEVTGDLDLPTSVYILGQTVDLTQLKDAVAPVKEQAAGFIAQLNQLATQVPQLKVPFESADAQTWQLNTYVDDNLRIARGDGGAVFIWTRKD